MGTFSSETADSGKFETLNAVKNGLIWLLLRSWFLKCFRGSTPTRGTHGKITSLLLLLCYNDTTHCDLLAVSVCDCQILKTVIL